MPYLIFKIIDGKNEQETTYFLVCIALGSSFIQFKRKR